MDHLEFQIQITIGIYLLPSMILPPFPLVDLFQMKNKHHYAAIHEWTNIFISKHQAYIDFNEYHVTNLLPLRLQESLW